MNQHKYAYFISEGLLWKQALLFIFWDLYQAAYLLHGKHKGLLTGTAAIYKMASIFINS